jgi:hypothetical protein
LHIHLKAGDVNAIVMLRSIPSKHIHLKVGDVDMVVHAEINSLIAFTPVSWRCRCNYHADIDSLKSCAPESQ